MRQRVGPRLSPVLGTLNLGLVGHATLPTASSLTPLSPAFSVPWFINYLPPPPRITAAVVGSAPIIVTQTAWRLAELPAGQISETIGPPPLYATGAFTGSPSLGSSILLVVANLAARGLATGSPALASPTPIDVLPSPDLTTGSPVFSGAVMGAPLARANGLSPIGPGLGSPSMLIIHRRDAGGRLADRSVPAAVASWACCSWARVLPSVKAGLGCRMIGQELSAAALTSSPPAFVSPAPPSRIFNFTAALAFTTASFACSVRVQLFVYPHPRTTSALIAGGIASVTQTSYRQTELPGSFLDETLYQPSLYAQSLTAGTPVFAAPLVSQIYDLSAAAIPGASPVFGLAAPINRLTAAAFVDSSPAFTVPTFGYVLHGCAVDAVSARDRWFHHPHYRRHLYCGRADARQRRRLYGYFVHVFRCRRRHRFANAA